MAEETKIEEFKSVDQIIALIPDDQRDKVKDSVVNFIDSKTKKEMTAEDFKKFANDPLNETITNSVFDSRVSLAVNKFQDNFKNNKLPELLEAEIKKRFPAKTQQEIENAELKDQLDNLKVDIRKEKQTNIALQKMEDLPEGINPMYFIGETDEETINNVQKFKDILIAWRDEAVKAKDSEWLAKTADDPKAGIDGEITKSYAEATMDERNAYFKKYGQEKFNVWSKSKK